ncbi:hypothetical protein CERSUDRAFT_119471 [Gelatoporia subvermispora B]|uniref:Uncharacterized protein n=1 Tax=Ceriporiopsis subvermispora (strain B) TaxID=914234 RepID=M2QHU1_CERS8|nr:hypothetical protein CERSUDRAFT_119471 [Gelatoporia subvermispora B]
MERRPVLHAFAFFVLEQLLSKPALEQDFYFSALDWATSQFSQWLMAEFKALQLPPNDKLAGETGSQKVFASVARCWHSDLDKPGAVYEARKDLFQRAAPMLERRKNILQLQTSRHRTHVQQLQLDYKPEHRDRLLSGVQTVLVHRLPSPVAQKGVWVCDSQQIFDLWSEHCKKAPQPDTRRPRPVAQVVQDGSYQHIAEPGESARFVELAADGKERLVMLVIRNFCEHDPVLDWVDTTIKEQVDHRTNIRKEDTGSLAQVGWSAGSRSAPKFNWVRNLKSKSLAWEQVRSLDFRASSVFALLWNMAQNRLPEEVRQDFKAWLETSGIHRMTRETPGEEKGCYGIYDDPMRLLFRDVPMAPPGGVCAFNYSRPIHDEVQPHKWAFSWTTSRAAGFPDRPELNCRELDGLHFILACYGIKVKAARDTLVVWVPRDEHGTSLPNIAPIFLDPKQTANVPALQQGAAIVTSPRLMGVWHKYEKQVWSQEVEDAAQEEYALLGHGDE